MSAKCVWAALRGVLVFIASMAAVVAFCIALGWLIHQLGRWFVWSLLVLGFGYLLGMFVVASMDIAGCVGGKDSGNE